MTTVPRGLPDRCEAIRKCAYAALILIGCMVLLAVAALAGAPKEVMPLLVLIGAGGPMVATLELSLAVRALRRASHAGPRVRMISRIDARAIDELRKQLALLPETPHPLGL